MGLTRYESLTGRQFLVLYKRARQVLRGKATFTSSMRRRVARILKNDCITINRKDGKFAWTVQHFEGTDWGFFPEGKTHSSRAFQKRERCLADALVQNYEEPEKQDLEEFYTWG